MLILSLKSPLGKVNKVCMYVCMYVLSEVENLITTDIPVLWRSR